MKLRYYLGQSSGTKIIWAAGPYSDFYTVDDLAKARTFFVVLGPYNDDKPEPEWLRKVAEPL